MPTRCYYEVLGVQNSADNAELKRAYRLCALQWHPDKNIGNEGMARIRFQEIQEAYNVLSDIHERAWYDKHRDQILNASSDKTCFDVFPYFTRSCYETFDDSEKGFYTVYRTVFQNIADEDEAAVGRGEHVAPTFGDSESSYQEVVESFYAYWSFYSTKMSFARNDEKIAREYGRKAVKLIEKENAKRRDKLKRERNEEVRNLVAFVKKRDKRVEIWAKKMKDTKTEQSQRMEALRKEQILQNKRINESYEECDWSKFESLEKELDEVEKHVDQQFSNNNADGGSESDNDDERNQSLVCIACNKLFHSEKAFVNHENSKKHKQNSAKLQA